MYCCCSTVKLACCKLIFHFPTLLHPSSYTALLPEKYYTVNLIPASLIVKECKISVYMQFEGFSLFLVSFPFLYLQYFFKPLWRENEYVKKIILYLVAKLFKKLFGIHKHCFWLNTVQDSAESRRVLSETALSQPPNLLFLLKTKQLSKM